MRRREFVTLLGAAAAGWPLAARAQQGSGIRRISLLAGALNPGNPDAQASIKAFQEVLEQLGWFVGRNLQIDYRWALGNAANVRKYAEELAALAPDVIVANGTVTVGPLLQATRSVPIVFCNVADPVGAGFVKTMARPGGNATGFIQFGYTLGGKWLELLKQVAPRVARVAVLRDDGITSGIDITSGIGQFAVIQSVALGVEVSAIGLRDAREIDGAIAEFARASNDGGLIVTSSALATVHRELIIALAARHKLPAMYYRRVFVTNGGLISYGYDVVAQFSGAASYVDRILKGEKPADLPVQAPTKYDLVINLKTAKALGIEVPPTLLVRADEVIE